MITEEAITIHIDGNPGSTFMELYAALCAEEKEYNDLSFHLTALVRTVDVKKVGDFPGATYWPKSFEFKVIQAELQRRREEKEGR